MVLGAIGAAVALDVPQPAEEHVRAQRDVA
jgi:hypothetical protein